MRIVSFITRPKPIVAILAHLGLPTTPPPTSPARGPPQAALDFDGDSALDLDQTPAFDLAEPEPVPELQLDQSGGA